MESAESIKLEYRRALMDLKENSKVRINVLTMLAEENAKYAEMIVGIIQNHIRQVNSASRLYVLYLVDSIIKNSGDPYTTLLANCLGDIFLLIFKEGNEKTRESLFRLRTTWTPFFSAETLYAMDVRVKEIDPAWPVADHVPIRRTTVLELSPPSAPGNGADFSRTAAFRYQSGHLSAPYSEHGGSNMIDTKPPKPIYVGPKILTSKPLKVNPAVTQKTLEARRQAALMRQQREQLRMEFERQLAKERAEILAKQKELEEKEREINDQRHMLSQQSWQLERDRAARNVTNIINTAENHSMNKVPSGSSVSKPRAVDVEHSVLRHDRDRQTTSLKTLKRSSDQLQDSFQSARTSSSKILPKSPNKSKFSSKSLVVNESHQLPQCSSDKGMKLHPTNSHVTTRGIKPRSGKPKFVAKHQPDRPFRARNRSIKERKTADSKDLDRNEIVEIVTVEDDKSCPKHSSKHRKSVGSTALSMGKGRGRGGTKSPVPSTSKKSEKKKMETKSKSRSKVKQSDSSPAQPCEHPLAAVSQVTVVGCGLEEEMDDDVEVVREIGCAPGIVIKVENCDASDSYTAPGQHQLYSINHIKDRSLLDRNQALPPKKRKRYSIEKDNWDCQPSRIMHINTFQEFPPNEQIAFATKVIDGFSEEVDVAGEHCNGPSVSVGEGNTMADCVQTDADDVIIEDGFAGFDEDEIECIDLFNLGPSDGVNNVPPSQSNAPIDSIEENISDSCAINNQTDVEEHVSEMEASNAGMTDEISHSQRQLKKSFFSEPTSERSIYEYLKSADAVSGRSKPRPPSLLDIVLENERNGIIGSGGESMQYGQYSIDEFSRPPRGRAEIGNFIKGFIPGPAEPTAAVPPVLPKPKPLLQGYLTKPKPVEDDDQKPDVSGRSHIGREDPNRPLFRFRFNRGGGSSGGRNIEWLRYKTNRFAIGCHVYDHGELDSPNVDDNFAVEDFGMPDNNDYLNNDRNADENLAMSENTLAANQHVPEEPVMDENAVRPHLSTNEEFRNNPMPFRPEVPPFRGGPQFNRPPRPRFPFDEPYRGPPRQNWTRPPRQPAPRKQPKKIKDPYILVMEQAHRLVNAAEHKLKAGEIDQKDYDSIMKDLRRLNRYRRPGYPHYHLNHPRRQPLLNEQDERSLMQQPQQFYNLPYYQYDEDSGQPLMSQSDSVGTDPDLPEEAVKEELDESTNRSTEITDGRSTSIPTSNQALDPLSLTNSTSSAAGLMSAATGPVGMTQSNASGMIRPRPPLGAILPPPPPIGFRPNIYDPNLLQSRALQPGVPLLLPRNHIIPPPGIHAGGSPARSAMPVPPGLGVPPIGYFPFSCPTIPPIPVGRDINQQNRTEADSTPADNMAVSSEAPRAPELSQPSNGNLLSHQSSGFPNAQIPADLSIMSPPAFEQTNPSFRKPSPAGGKSSVSPSGVQGEAADETNADSAATEYKRKGSDSSDKQDEGDDDDEDGPQVIVPSKTIFVDGRPYEVQYIGEAAVIERSGLPHRVYFQGPPREVVIDGTAYMLAFQEQKTIMIDGQCHALMFGAPARELIIGGFPLRGNFGGAPIFIKMKGITHKIQICGPPPEVKIDPEPDYELYRFMPNQQLKHNNYRPMFESGAVLRPGMPLPPMPMPPPPGFLAKLIAQGMLVLPPRFPLPGLLNPSLLAPNMPPLPGLPAAPASLNVSDLLDRLVKAGLVPRTESTSSAAGSTSTASIANPDSQSTPHFAAQQTLGGPRTAFISQGVAPTERRQRSTQVLKEFNMRDLRVRYQSEIDSLYVYGLQCDNCGMRYGEGDADRYSQHLDWHFQFHRRSKTVQAHGWLIALEDWIRYDEMGEEAANAKHMVFESLADTDDIVHSVEDETLEESRDCPVLFAPDEEQSCEVCDEAFIAYYDGSDDSWKIRNVIAVDDKLYHPICHQDASQQQESSIEEVMPAASGEDATTAAAIPAAFVKKELLDPSFASIADTAFNIIQTLKSAAHPGASSLEASARYGNVIGKHKSPAISNNSSRPSTSVSTDTDNPSDSMDIYTDNHYSSLSITGGRPASSCGASGANTGTTAGILTIMTRTKSSPELGGLLSARPAPTASVIYLEKDDTPVSFAS